MFRLVVHTVTARL